MFSDLTDEMGDLDGYSIEPKFFLDVPFVPTDDALIAAMLRLVDIKKTDTLYDLGAGDGRIVITAAQKFGIRAIGVELDPLRVSEAMEDAAHARVEHLVDFLEEDLFKADFSSASVVTMYLMDSVNVMLRPRLLNELRPGTRIVSHAFDMGDWRADVEESLGGITLYKWVIPAKVEGTWQWEGVDGCIYHLELQQKYQDVTGEVWVDDEPAQLVECTLNGARLDLRVQTHDSDQPQYMVLSFEADAKNPELEWF
ncbi:class I SAM-dependent methyltransferase [Paenalcaligenes hominis]|uniref:class I SAM-dependent methyltransferase n=1 Tax=Paenalcaligenes hominis TaxID=643674 RepID=UPI0035242B45